MKVLVVGASAGTGWQAVQHLLQQGHEVTAFARSAPALPELSPRLRRFEGDAMRPQDLERAMPGHDAVVVTLGIHEPALRVRLFGPARTPPDVRSAGTRHVIAAMQRHGLRRLVVQTSFGVGPTRERLPPMARLIFALLLKPQIADTERQERLVRDSGLDWVIVQPVNLTDAVEPGAALASPSGETRGLKVSRQQVAAFIGEAISGTAPVGRTVALSGS
ncbi:NAD(P)-dependent oxidoreductase [Piscinibacter sp.]|uniref:NAD(P)-dependent oxidoreductase n=1 Tax=Piscinibacter sp. TaxID=1903157 RepID=UPI002B9BB2A5|nr:NAD(P)-binding oxidoreductase [Albitalea sp.]HUG22771.1 NAD(P)-binding oxidoreductase [Albitalea sp.]